MMTLFQFAIDLRSRTSEIALVDEFEPAIQGYLQAFLIIAALAAFFYMLWGAFEWITAGGESGKVESARKKITGAIIGLTVLACVGVLFLVLQSFLGINVISGGGGSSSGPPVAGDPTGSGCSNDTTCASRNCLGGFCQ